MKAEIWTEGGGVVKYKDVNHVRLGLGTHPLKGTPMMTVYVNNKEVVMTATLVDVREDD